MSPNLVLPQILSTGYFICVPWGTWWHYQGLSSFGGMFIGKLPEHSIILFHKICDIVSWRSS